MQDGGFRHGHSSLRTAILQRDSLAYRSTIITTEGDQCDSKLGRARRVMVEVEVVMSSTD